MLKIFSVDLDKFKIVWLWRNLELHTFSMIRKLSRHLNSFMFSKNGYYSNGPEIQSVEGLNSIINYKVFWIDWPHTYTGMSAV